MTLPIFRLSPPQITPDPRSCSYNHTMETNDDGLASLPPYLSRHFQLGFEADDVNALIEDIDASQSSRIPKLPHIPMEIVCMIVHHVSVDCALPWRLVCRTTRDYVDGPLLYEYIRRIELIGHFNLLTEDPTDGDIGVDSQKRLYRMRFLHAQFERLEAPVVSKQKSGQRPAKWDESLAIFQIDQAWIDDLTVLKQELPTTSPVMDAWLYRELDKLQLFEGEQYFSTLRWCIRVDQSVGDLQFPIEAAKNLFTVDLGSGQVYECNC
ncbi:unnamed protein product [Periconia digitata]|uniref:F-box domain-containing protein n=1 Tax=Periconia digitata TaxID=1303443 RepID=A0A9W4USA9_9PLEO|nr:unnamed protein product [Periconia digitata]